MKKFVKKNNLGMIFGFIIFVIILLTSTFNYLTFRKNSKKVNTILYKYFTDVDKAAANIPSTNNSKEKDNLISVIDKYWTDDYSQKDINQPNYLYDNMIKLIEESIATGASTDITRCTSTISYTNYKKVSGKIIDVQIVVYFDIESSTPSYDDYKSAITGTGLYNISDSNCINTTIRFENKNGKWKISAIYDSDHSDYSGYIDL